MGLPAHTDLWVSIGGKDREYSAFQCTELQYVYVTRLSIQKPL